MRVPWLPPGGVISGRLSASAVSDALEVALCTRFSSRVQVTATCLPAFGSRPQSPAAVPVVPLHRAHTFVSRLFTRAFLNSLHVSVPAGTQTDRYTMSFYLPVLFLTCLFSTKYSLLHRGYLFNSLLLILQNSPGVPPLRSLCLVPHCAWLILPRPSISLWCRSRPYTYHSPPNLLLIRHVQTLPHPSFTG